MRATRICLPVVLALVALAACAGPGADPMATAAASPARTAQVDATFAAASGAAITYRPDLVPVGSGAKVTSKSADGTSTVTLTLRGLLPDRHYGAHAHAKACGAAPTDAGPHFQNKKDPVTPSVDPAYANPQNEVWLDVTTDAQGNATTTATVPFAFTDAAHPASVVVHANHTATDPGKAGTAGDRLACVNVAF